MKNSTTSDVPQGINPKSYKIEQIVSELTRPYLIVLDDDSVINFSKMGELTDYLGENVKAAQTNQGVWWLQKYPQTARW